MITLTGKNILITGASSGLGEATAIKVSEVGGRCFLLGTNKDRLEKVQKQCVNSEYIQFDLTEKDYSPVWQKAKTFGKFDGLVHCAGKKITKPLAMYKDEDFDLIFNTNVKSAFKLLNGYLKPSVSNTPNSVILVSSISAIEGFSANSIYSASKGALISFTKSLSSEYGKKGYRFNCLAPGVMDTPMSKELIESMKQVNNDSIAGTESIGKPNDFAFVAVFLLSELSKLIQCHTIKMNITKQNLKNNEE